MDREPVRGMRITAVCQTAPSSSSKKKKGDIPKRTVIQKQMLTLRGGYRSVATHHPAPCPTKVNTPPVPPLSE